MAAFLAPVDIGNRALDYLGVPHIASLDDDTKAASLIKASYDKLREAELRRNVWRFAIRRAVLYPFQLGMFLLKPAAWNALTVYTVGQIVQDTAGTWWVSQWNNNVSVAPGSALAGRGGVQPWVEYFGSPMVTPWGAIPNAFQATAYYAADLVYAQYFNGQVLVYYSLANGNVAIPGTQPVWSAATIYYPGQIVLGSDNFFYKNLWQVNVNVNPTAYGGILWNSTTIYQIGALVADPTDGKLYKAISVNANNLPSAHPLSWNYSGLALPWAPSFSDVATGFNTSWAVQPGVSQITQPYILYPLGSGPSTDAASRNIFQLPVGYLREAPQDPKAGSVEYLGAPSGLGYNDWEYESGYIVSRSAYPLVYRFVADTADVANMDAMFCEGLACRLAMALCESLTQSAEKLTRISQAYQKFMTEARLVNGIETKPVEPPEDNYITCRA